MTGDEFIRRVKRLGGREGIKVQFVARRGKGNHGALFCGSRFTIVRDPRDELKKGTLNAMVNSLGLDLSGNLSRGYAHKPTMGGTFLSRYSIGRG